MQGGPFLARLQARSEPSKAQAKGGPKGPDERADAVFGAWAPNRRSCAERRVRNGPTVNRIKATPKPSEPRQREARKPRTNKPMRCSAHGRRTGEVVPKGGRGTGRPSIEPTPAKDCSAKILTTLFAPRKRPPNTPRVEAPSSPTARVSTAPAAKDRSDRD